VHWFFIMAMKICRRPGCTELVLRGYCAKHKQDPRECWKKLDAKKSPDAKEFYSSAAWTKVSIRHKAIEPLCRRCKAEGIISVVEIVHHNPSREELIRTGRSPLDDKWLESVCFNHHQGELRGKRRAH
jgi:hypothetical protein